MYIRSWVLSRSVDGTASTQFLNQTSLSPQDSSFYIRKILYRSRDEYRLVLLFPFVLLLLLVKHLALQETHLLPLTLPFRSASRACVQLGFESALFFDSTGSQRRICASRDYISEAYIYLRSLSYLESLYKFSKTFSPIGFSLAFCCIILSLLGTNQHATTRI